jgi:flagellar basal body rod protein FlgG
MLAGLYSAASGLNALEMNQEVVARNLAHVNVPGFRRGVISFEELEAAYEQATLGDTSQAGNGAEVAEVQTDFSEGSLQHTGRSLDLALNGDGFFVLDGPEGPLYTRSGVFYLSADGQLVSGDGRPVQGDSGPLQLPADTSPASIQVTAEGDVYAGGSQVGRLRIVSFADNQLLVPVGTTSFMAPDGAEPQEAEAAVQQGFREMSNVVVVEELVRMIAGLRLYEAAQRAMKTISDAVGQTTSPETG